MILRASMANKAKARERAASTIKAVSVVLTRPRPYAGGLLRLIHNPKVGIAIGARRVEGGIAAAFIVPVASFMVALLLYLIGKAVAEKGRKTEAELSPYACGEIMPPVRPRMDMSRFFTYVLLFLAFDITVPIVALAILGHYLQVTLYLTVMLIAVMTPALYLRELMGR